MKNNNIDCTSSQYPKPSPHFPLRPKIGQLSKNTKGLCWSIYILYGMKGADPIISTFAYVNYPLINIKNTIKKIIISAVYFMVTISYNSAQL